jgi:hypothetical protein
MTRCFREYRPCENSRVPRRCWLPQSAHLSEALAQFGNEQLRLLKRGEVTTFRNLVPVEELRIGLVAPYLRWCKKVTFEDAHCNWQIDGHTREILCETLKVNPRRGGGGSRPCLELLIDRLMRATNPAEIDESNRATLKTIRLSRAAPALRTIEESAAAVDLRLPQRERGTLREVAIATATEAR